MLLAIHPQNPQEKKIKEVAECLKDGGLIIYPTDTVYGIGCDIFNARAIERICIIKGVKPEKATFSFVCHDLSHLSDFTLPFDKQVYKLMNKHLPGPYTFILNAANTVPKLLRSKRKTVGIRVPDNKIAQAIVKALGNPILSASLKYNIDAEDVLEYPTDPEEIFAQYGQLVDMVIDGGFGNNTPSTVIDCAGAEIEIIRQGLGELEL